MDENTQNDKMAEEFLEFLNGAISRNLVGQESYFSVDDFNAAHMIYDFSVLQLTTQVMSLGVSEFAKRQFFMGVLWERFKATKSDNGKFDADLLNGINLDGLK